MIEVKNAVKRFDNGFTAVDNVSFSVKAGETFALLGKSGCGKTTTLKMINRLVESDGGEILIKGRNVKDVDPIVLRRGMGYVIQDIGLFPHLNIAGNIAVVPRLLQWDREKIDKRTAEVMDVLKLPVELLSRYPHQLSGGQKQRIGIARALAADPEVLLMDEPFGALDPITREEIQREFLKIQQRLRKTIVFITHDVYEAFLLGNRIAVMGAGKILRQGTPEDLLQNPGDESVSGFIGRHRTALLELKEMEESP